VPDISFVVESDISRSTRVRMLGSMFDCPVEAKQRIEYKFSFPFEQEPWKVGLIVGPSGAGKSTVMNHVFGGMPELSWSAKSVIDDFDSKMPIDHVAAACQAVGFNTIPAWMRPHAVLSNGEKFRVDVARRMLELPSPIVIDEFTSVVDRQVAQVGSHAVQKYVRRGEKQLVAVTCHYDVIDWLQPDWVLDMATQSFTRRSLQRRPELDCTIARVPYAAWYLFAPFHYMSATLHRSARCFGLWCNGNLASIVAVLNRPHPIARDIVGISRGVTLPDWQGLGLQPMLADRIAAAYKAVGKRLHIYPAHPALIRTYDKSSTWRMVKKPGTIDQSNRHHKRDVSVGDMGGRACAVFEWAGPALDRAEAERVLAT
jgi:ABC-type lipoprotein export system ATPase subunit